MITHRGILFATPSDVLPKKGELGAVGKNDLSDAQEKVTLPRY